MAESEFTGGIWPGADVTPRAPSSVANEYWTDVPRKGQTHGRSLVLVVKTDREMLEEVIGREMANDARWARSGKEVAPYVGKLLSLMQGDVLLQGRALNGNQSQVVVAHSGDVLRSEQAESVEDREARVFKTAVVLGNVASRTPRESNIHELRFAFQGVNNLTPLLTYEPEWVPPIEYKGPIFHLSPMKSPGTTA
jgi:hypothetical protein